MWLSSFNATVIRLWVPGPVKIRRTFLMQFWLQETSVVQFFNSSSAHVTDTPATNATAIAIAATTTAAAAAAATTSSRLAILVAMNFWMSWYPQLQSCFRWAEGAYDYSMCFSLMTSQQKSFHLVVLVGWCFLCFSSVNCNDASANFLSDTWTLPNTAIREPGVTEKKHQSHRHVGFVCFMLKMHVFFLHRT